jgi:ABC-type dipeptide/oligopeptide/nickel transport system permease component
MGRYIIRRLLIAIPLLIGVSLILYFLMRLAPGGPEAVYGQNPHLTADDLKRLKRLMGLDDPIHVAYAKWLYQFAQGNMGSSIFTGRPVTEMLWDRIPNTILLMGASLVLSLVIGVTFGVVSAIRQYSWFDYSVTSFAFFGYSMPTFWFGIMLMMIFAANDYTFSLGGQTLSFGHWLPAAGMFSAGFEGGLSDILKVEGAGGWVDAVRNFSPLALVLGFTGMIGITLSGKRNLAPVAKGLGFAVVAVVTLNVALWGLAILQHLAPWADLTAHMILPTAVLCIVSIASWSRFARSSMLEVIRMDYIRMARAKGLSERVVIGKHALRNSLVPIVTIVALAIPGLFAGAVITEQIFAWPGVGRLFIDSLNKSDYPVVMAIMFISAVLVVVSNLLADVLYAALDPRIRFN